jgi:hypothetical protein
MILALWTLSRGWEASIMDRHDFRQIQTAFSIQWLKETGFQAAYETPLFGPPWSIPMEFPVYQGLVAAVSSLLGTGLEPTGRGVSVVFLLLMLPAVFLLAGQLGLQGRHRLWPVATTLLAPIYLFYGRTVMIETTAVCLSVWFMYGLVRTVRERHPGFAVLATLCATGAALAKITTFLAFVPAAGLAIWWFGASSWRDRQATPAARASVLVLVAIPFLTALLATLWWVGFSDQLKAANPFADFLTSDALSPWNWGTWDQRFDPGFWREIAHSLKGYVFSPASLTVLAVSLACCTRATRWLAAVALGLFLAGPLSFANLYWRHDYYFCANAVLLLFAAGFALADVTKNPGIPVALRRLLPLLFFAGQWFGYQANFGDYTRRELPSAPGVATAIQASTPADGVVLIYGWDWNATVPYYAHRRAIMVRNGYEDDTASLDRILDQLAPLRVAALLVNNPSLQRSPAFIRERTERFGLAPTPLTRGEAGDLYVSEEVFLTAAQTLQDRLPEDTTLNVSFENSPVDAALTDHPVDTVSLPVFLPAPTRARAMHGFVAGEHEGQPSLMAHPTAELHFTPPETARRVVVNYGIYPGAYAADASSVTDGVTFEIFEVRDNGVRRLLFRRTLDPAEAQADRGTQSEELDAGPFRGVLVFRTTPGPAGRFNSDWAYWSRIEIR